MNPNNHAFFVKEEDILALNHWLQVQESALRQKARIQWLSLTDNYTKFFHTSIHERQSHDRIKNLIDSDGVVMTDPSHIDELIINFTKIC